MWAILEPLWLTCFPPPLLPSPELLRTICIFLIPHSENYWEHEYNVNLMLDDMKEMFQYFGVVVGIVNDCFNDAYFFERILKNLG